MTQTQRRVRYSGTMAWDPDRYLHFADQRLRPGVDLLARIPDINPRQIVDLGCGTGNLTAQLARRWPEAKVTGIDSSEEMVEHARRTDPSIAWRIGDIETWVPDGPIDLIFSNAALHWVDDHQTQFKRLRSFLADGGVLAVQMPGNWDAPTHRIPADVLDSEEWPDAASTSLLRDRLAPPAMYADWTQPATVDMWRTTYFQKLTGDDPVWTWVTGSVLRPVLANLGPADRERFERRCRTRYREAYPVEPDGSTVLPFSRFFIVAQATAPRIR